MTNLLSVRLMQFEDLPELATIFVRAYENPEKGEPWNEQSAYTYLADCFRKQPDLAFVGTYNNNLAGAMIVDVRPWWDGNHLFGGEFFVNPQYQNQKIGHEILKRVLQVAIEKYSPVVWETWTFRNEEFPLNWYKRMGAQEIKEWVMLRADITKIQTI